MLIRWKNILLSHKKKPSHELLNSTGRVEFHSFRLLYLWRYLIGSAIKIISDESMMMMWWVRMYLLIMKYYIWLNSLNQFKFYEKTIQIKLKKQKF